VSRTTLDAKALAANHEAMMLTRLYALRVDAGMSVKGTHAILKSDYPDAYTTKCKTAKMEDKDLSAADWKNISRFMLNWIKKMGVRGNTLRKPGSGRLPTQLSAVCVKIVEKTALGRGGSSAKARAALAAKGYKISKSSLLREIEIEIEIEIQTRADTRTETGTKIGAEAGAEKEPETGAETETETESEASMKYSNNSHHYVCHQPSNR
jgi:hypothetical protein